MTGTTKKKLAKVGFKSGSLVVSSALPIWAYASEFPENFETQGEVKTLSAGMIICLVIVALAFRKQIWQYVEDKIKEKFSTKYTLIGFWFVFFIASMVLNAIASLMASFVTVGVAGLVGSAIGLGIDFVGEKVTASEQTTENNKEQGKE